MFVTADRWSSRDSGGVKRLRTMVVCKEASMAAVQLLEIGSSGVRDSELRCVTARDGSTEFYGFYLI